MLQNKKNYAVRLDKDPITRQKIALMRLAGFSIRKISNLTGRHERTIENEIMRPEHKKLLLRGLRAAKRNMELPQKEWAVVEQELIEQEA